MNQERFGRDILTHFDTDDASFNDNFTDVLDELVNRCPIANTTVVSGYYLVLKLRCSR